MTVAPTETSASTQPAPTPEVPDLRFQGEIDIRYIENGGMRDLDQKPPLRVEMHNPNGDLWFNSAVGGNNKLNAVGFARIAETDNLTSPPGYADCRHRTDISGVNELRIHAGDVLCVRTSEGRVGLLFVQALTEPPTPGHWPTCDVTVWEPAV